MYVNGFKLNNFAQELDCGAISETEFEARKKECFRHVDLLLSCSPAILLKSKL
jgi:hypothetical protein